MKKQAKQALREMSLLKLNEELVKLQRKLAEARLKMSVGGHKGKPASLLADEIAVLKIVMEEKKVTKKTK